MVLNNYTEKIERPVRALLFDKERTFGSIIHGKWNTKIFDYEVQKNISTAARDTDNIEQWFR